VLTSGARATRRRRGYGVFGPIIAVVVIVASSSW
jgi:hypothetical protein